MVGKIITLSHGSGGAESAALWETVFKKRFGNATLDRLEDSAVVDVAPYASVAPKTSDFETEQAKPAASFETEQAKSEAGFGTELAKPAAGRGSAPQIAVSTDSFVVTPLVFPGGDIGKLAAVGTINDVLMSGATPLYLTCGFIIEAGLSIQTLDGICASLAAVAAEAGVTIIAGDTKVIESRNEEGGLIINTTGIGVFPGDAGDPISGNPAADGIRPGDSVIVSGNLGDHHAAILSARMGIKNEIKSDCALLAPIVRSLREAGIRISAMRDVTRGGLGTVLNELAAASGVSIMLEEERIPVSREVRAFCGMMGLDPLYMGNEGKVALAVAPEDAERALALISKTVIGRNAAVIGEAYAGDATAAPVAMRTRLGGTIRIDVLHGEGLPRIC